MILAVDLGNSAAKAAIVDGADVLEAGRLDTSAADANDLLDGLRVLAGSGDAAPDAILCVSVVDRWTRRLEWAAEQMDLSLTVVAASHIPISTALLRPDQTGPDRLLAAWAAATIVGTPVIVVDLGTATTVDAVDADGFFLGGAILPGLAVGADVLAERTARLPRIELALPDEAIGDGTAAAIASGVVIGHIGAVRELVTRMSTRVAAGNVRPTIIMTGGHCEAPWAEAAWTQPAGDLPPVADRLDHELLLRGLGLLAAQMSAHPGVRVDR